MTSVIDEAAFRDDLVQRGCTELRLVEWEAGRVNPEHSHEFSARGLILEGEFIITTRDGARHFGPGEIFELAAGIPHMESVGSAGARVLSGRFYQH